jgi:hypothetical protein
LYVKNTGRLQDLRPYRERLALTAELRVLVSL